MRRTGLLLLAVLLGGFTLQPAIVPVDEIVPGGPPKDGIPALTDPPTETATQASRWLDDDDVVLGVVVGGRARAYPLRILNWHEIVNDHLADKAIVVSFCPLCGSGIVFDTTDRFGVSGLLYQSDVLLYDRRTETLWSQLMMRAVAGPRAGERLRTMQVTHATWRAWRRRHPDTTVLSRHTGYARDYDRNPYAGYERSRALYFPVRHRDERLHPKTWVIGLELDGRARAWPVDAIRRQGQIREHWNGRNIVVRHREGLIDIVDADSGATLNGVVLFWFAWATFHPDTSLFTSPSAAPSTAP